jgi:hypothetical protein
MARLAMVAGTGPATAPIAAEPVPKKHVLVWAAGKAGHNRGNAAATTAGAGVTFVTGAGVLFVIVIVKVAISPEKTQEGLPTTGPVMAIPIVNLLTVRIFEFFSSDVTVAPLWAFMFINWIVPLSTPAVEYLNVIVPIANTTRLRGFGL